ncbi:MAG: GntR family transcriptional regulator [Elainellaceae cyanobacterium]
MAEWGGNIPVDQKSMTQAAPASSPRPLHLAISETLLAEIEDGTYAAGEQLPSEYQLMLRFEVSRITIRRAIANLASQGLVEAQRGRGVFVKEQHKVAYRLSNPLVFFEEDLARQGVTSSIHNLSFDLIPAPDEVSQCLHLRQPNPQVYRQIKILLINQSPAAVDTSYILPNLGERYSEELQQQMTFPTLEQHGIVIERIEATFESSHANAELSQYLDMPLGSPLLTYRYTAYTQGDRPIVCGAAPSRGDRLRYSVTLSRTPSLDEERYRKF